MNRLEKRVGPQRLEKRRFGFVGILVFVAVAAGAVAGGVYLSKLAPVEDDSIVATRPARMRRSRPAEAQSQGAGGIVDGQMESLKRSFDALKNRQKEMQELLPESERDPASVRAKGSEAADAIFKKNKTLDDYKKILMEAVKSLGNFGKDITEETK